MNTRQGSRNAQDASSSTAATTATTKLNDVFSAMSSAIMDESGATQNSAKKKRKVAATQTASTDLKLPRTPALLWRANVVLKPNAKTHHPSLWYEDGHVLVIALDGLCFKLHPGILSRHSKVLKDKISTAQSQMHPNAPAEGSSAVSYADTTLYLDDTGEHLSELFGILYDGGCHPFLDRTRSIQFERLRIIMLLAMKYSVQHIVDSAVMRLQVLFPSNIDDWTDWVAADKVDHPIAMTSSDAIAVAHLARMLPSKDMLPVALYICSILPSETLIHGITYGGEKVILSLEDQAECQDAAVQMMEVNIYIVGAILEAALDKGDGHHAPLCRAAFRKLALRVLADDLLARNNCFASLMPWINDTEVEIGERLCPGCKASLETQLDQRRRTAWAKLGERYHVPNWPPQNQKDEGAK
ncbi:hypothetical protein BDW22DRAFT_1357024 [Trametopsis cervina]|nr:hypothetical protein BDW22DRAFT_1357024 [Trametopsis cervina]